MPKCHLLLFFLEAALLGTDPWGPRGYPLEALALGDPWDPLWKTQGALGDPWAPPQDPGGGFPCCFGPDQWTPG